MSVQIFLQGKLVGIEEFLLAPAHENDAVGAGPCGETLLSGRSQWVTLLSEVLPRALLAELGLARILLGSSGGGQFLVVLPSESRPRADEFLGSAAAGIARLSGGRLRLVWAVTENLGDWSVVRKRLTEEMRRRRGFLAAALDPQAFQPFNRSEPPDTGGYFSGYLGCRLRTASSVGWSHETPATILVDEGKHTWSTTASTDSIPLARHAAPDDSGEAVAGLETLAARAQGRPVWGVLRGDVDSFGIRMRRLQTIEEHVQISVLYKQFFAGELEVLCSLPEFWRKVTVLYSGGDDFAVCGAWDALILLAREIQRLFHRFGEENLKDFPGAEGKTISMAVAMAPASGAPLAGVYEEAGRGLEFAKSADKDCFFLLGRTVEWKQLAHATELKDTMGRMIDDFGCSPRFLTDLIRSYKESVAAPPGGPSRRFDRPWRFHRRLSLVAGEARDREFQKLRSHLIVELIGKNTAQARLRPAGRVALEWTSLLAEKS